MSDEATIVLHGSPITITADMRRGVLDEMPEIGWIQSEDLRDKVLNAWAAALKSGGFSRLGELKASGNYNSAPMRSGTQADHIRSVTRLAVKMAEEMDALFPNFRYDRDALIAGSLCHDIGKVWEFSPDNIERWSRDPRKVGFPSLRHPGYGIHICLSCRLPESVAHMAAAHSGEGELLIRSLENTILRWADHCFWAIAEAGGQLEDLPT